MEKQAVRATMILGVFDTAALAFTAIAYVLGDIISAGLNVNFDQFVFALFIIHAGPALPIEGEFGAPFALTVLAYWLAKGPVFIIAAHRMKYRFSRWLRIVRTLLWVNLSLILLGLPVSTLFSDVRLLIGIGIPSGILLTYLWILQRRALPRR